MKHLILFRGLPGSGKTSLSSVLCDKVFSADMFFEDMMPNGDLVYNFDFTKLRDAHSWCQTQTENAMSEGIKKVGVANTFTQEWEMEHYTKLAEKYGYRLSTIVVENRHGGKNIHGVPQEKVEQMKERFEVKL